MGQVHAMGEFHHEPPSRFIGRGEGVGCRNKPQLCLADAVPAPAARSVAPRRSRGTEVDPPKLAKALNLAPQ